MANRQFTQFAYQLEKGLVRLYARVNIGATGAPTLVSTSTSSGNPSQGIVSIARGTAGKYTITLGSNSTSLDTYQRLVSVNVNVIASTISTVTSTQVSSETVATTSTVVIQCLAAAGTAVDPNNTDVLLIEIVLKNATV